MNRVHNRSGEPGVTLPSQDLFLLDGGCIGVYASAPHALVSFPFVV